MSHTAGGSTPHFRLVPLVDILTRPEPAWLVTGLIRERSLVLFCGPPQSAKSLVAQDCALSIAAHVEFLGREVKQGAVVYVAAEGQGGLRKRVEAWLKTHRLGPDLPVTVVEQPANLGRPAEVADLVDTIRAADIKPVLVVVDTLAQCMEGDENSTDGMNPAVKGACRIRDALQAAVLIIHHSTKKNPGVERGSTTLRAAADTVFGFAGQKEITITQSKAKDDEVASPFVVGLKVVDLEPSSKGEPRTSVVVESRGAAATGSVTVAKRGVSDIEPQALRVLAGMDGAVGASALTAQLHGPDGETLTADQQKKLRSRLVENKLVLRDRDGYYELTDRGRAAVLGADGADLVPPAPGTSPVLTVPCRATPPLARGVARGTRPGTEWTSPRSVDSSRRRPASGRGGARAYWIWAWRLAPGAAQRCGVSIHPQSTGTGSSACSAGWVSGSRLPCAGHPPPESSADPGRPPSVASAGPWAAGRPSVFCSLERATRVEVR